MNMTTGCSFFSLAPLLLPPSWLLLVICDFRAIASRASWRDGEKTKKPQRSRAAATPTVASYSQQDSYIAERGKG